jgi:hypothetical protein
MRWLQRVAGLDWAIGGFSFRSGHKEKRPRDGAAFLENLTSISILSNWNNSHTYWLKIFGLWMKELENISG